jgi:hypothetical protein
MGWVRWRAVGQHPFACETATLARRFTSEIILLHVVMPPGHVAGMPVHGGDLTARDRDEGTVRQGREDLEQAFLPEFDGLAVRRLLQKDDPAREIVIEPCRRAIKQRSDGARPQAVGWTHRG